MKIKELKRIENIILFFLSSIKDKDEKNLVSLENAQIMIRNTNLLDYCMDLKKDIKTILQDNINVYVLDKQTNKILFQTPLIKEKHE